MRAPNGERATVFVSYSHRDEKWLKRVQVHLKDLTRRGLIDLWDDEKIRAGDDWRKEIETALKSAKIAVLLISADFIASDFIVENELPPLLEAAEKRGLKILSLILSPSLYETIESISRYQSVNPPSKPFSSLRRNEQEKFLVKLSEDILRALENAAPTRGPIGQTGPRPLSNLPFPRNKFFTGREDALAHIHSSFSKGDCVQALNGLGGIGKTQTALEYAYRHQEEYNVVLWGNANSREALVTDFVKMAGLLGLLEKDAQDQNETVVAVKRWLENNSAWLLILDNADDIEMAEEFIPSNRPGHILLTSRAHATGEIVERNALKTMNPEDGAFFLLRRSKKIKKDDSLESAAPELRAQAEAISTMLDGLPLALDQAGAFIEENSSSIENYQSLYKSERQELLKRRGKLAKDHPSVAVTFSLAFKKVEENNQAAADLLRVCAFLEADSIPEEIFSEGAKELGEALGAIDENPLKLSDAFEEATRFSLLMRHPETCTLSLHPLVQVVLKNEMNDLDKRLWAERTVRAVSQAFPSIEYSNWSACGRLISHAQSFARVIEEYGFDFLEAAELLNQAGHYLVYRAQYGEAEPLLARALAIREKVLGAEDRIIATSVNGLAALYKHQGKYGEAEPLYVRALAICEKAFGPEHPNVATTLNNLAELYRNQGKYREAEPLYMDSLVIREKALSPGHPDVAQSLNNLALLYDSQGKYKEAEPLYVRALIIREKALGPEHPDVASSLNNLALLYHHQGKYGDAEPLYVRALAIREKALGPEHPDVASNLNNLAGLYYNQGNYGEAAQFYIDSLAILEKTLGPEHPNVANSLNNLAGLYGSQGKYGEAEPLLVRALGILEKAFGPKHPYVANSLNNLAALYSNQGKYEQSEPLLMRALPIWEKALGPEHPDIAICLDNLALLLQAKGQQAKAEELKARAFAIRKRVFQDKLKTSSRGARAKKRKKPRRRK
jgi:Tfp pilus assembly protein PilF